MKTTKIVYKRKKREWGGKKSALRKKGEEKEKKNRHGKKKAQNKVVEINSDVLVNIISVNGPNALGKRQRLS